MASARLSIVETTDPLDGFGLPGWTYHDAAFFAAEMERVIRPSWQIVCHVSDIPGPGDWRALDLLGESIVVVRGDDGAVRGFANVCRHRGMRLVEGAGGCAKKLVCPYHAWVYELDGGLSGVPMRRDYPGLRLEDNGLATVETEIWQGFVFIRLISHGGPSVAAMMAPAEAEIVPFRFADMQPTGRPWARPRAVNWKNVGDNYSDNLHIPVAHDGLTRLFGKSYAIESHGWADRMSGELDEGARGNFWERFYRAHLPVAAHLPEAYRRRWFYWKLWPNIAFDIYPDQIDYMHWVPTGPTTTMLRVASYALPDARREMRLARYANDRINRVVNREDVWLIEGVQQGMGSRLFTAGPLAESEVCLRSFARRMREIMPEARNLEKPLMSSEVETRWSTSRSLDFARDERI